MDYQKLTKPLESCPNGRKLVHWRHHWKGLWESYLHPFLLICFLVAMKLTDHSHGAMPSLPQAQHGRSSVPCTKNSERVGQDKLSFFYGELCPLFWYSSRRPTNLITLSPEQRSLVLQLFNENCYEFDSCKDCRHFHFREKWVLLIMCCWFEQALRPLGNLKLWILYLVFRVFCLVFREYTW